jgi:hypothetical protein
MEAIRSGLYDILEQQHPATVRGTFYQAVGRGLVGKTEAEYKTTVGRLLTDMRRSGRPRTTDHPLARRSPHRLGPRDRPHPRRQDAHPELRVPHPTQPP